MKKEIIKKSPYPFYLTGASWLIYSLLLPFYRLTDILIATALSAAVYFVSSKVFAPEVRVVEVEEVYTASGDRAADEMISKGQSMLRDIRVLNSKINNPALSERVSKLERICAQIFKEVQRKPRKAPLIRRSLDYYLPVALKLLDSYSNMSAQAVKGDNVQTSLRKIEDIMDTMLEAFSNKLDGLYKDEALDISTDITVLQGMLVQEGLLSDGLRDTMSSAMKESSVTGASNSMRLTDTRNTGNTGDAGDAGDAKSAAGLKEEKEIELILD